MSRADSSSVLPALRPRREKPPVPRPATLTRRPVRPRVVYCMGDLASIAGCGRLYATPAWRPKDAPKADAASGRGRRRDEETLGEVGGLHRHAEVVALPFVASHGPEKLRDRRALD